MKSCIKDLETIKFTKEMTTSSKIINGVITEIQIKKNKFNTREKMYYDYNERWIDRPAWSEHIDRAWSDSAGNDHSDHARTIK